jgi:hypothetical protein
MKALNHCGILLLIGAIATALANLPVTAQTAPSECLVSPHFLVNSIVGGDYTTIDLNGHIFGPVLSPSAQLSSDGDWNIEMFPDPSPPAGFESNLSLSTPEDHRRGNIENEICNKCLTILLNRVPQPEDKAQLDGIHVTDDAHAKTEIHPITGMRIAELGPSRPRPGDEVFRIVVGAGGTCPQAVARTVSPLPQATNALIQLSWPAPPPSTASVFIPAFEITEQTNGTPQAVLIDLDGVPIPRKQITSDGTLSGSIKVAGDQFPIIVTRTGPNITMSLNLSVSASSVGGLFGFETNGRVFDVHTTWDLASNVKVLVDSVADQHVVLDRGSHPFPVRRYQISTHIEPALPNVTWYLHSGAAGYSVPGPQMLGTGANLQFNYDIAPEHQLSTYSFSIEAQGPNGLSVYSGPIQLPHPSIRIREIADVETCTPITGGQERHINITLSAETANFASGHN